MGRNGVEAADSLPSWHLGPIASRLMLPAAVSSACCGGAACVLRQGCSVPTSSWLGLAPVCSRGCAPTSPGRCWCSRGATAARGPRCGRLTPSASRQEGHCFWTPLQPILWRRLCLVRCRVGLAASEPLEAHACLLSRADPACPCLSRRVWSCGTAARCGWSTRTSAAGPRWPSDACPANAAPAHQRLRLAEPAPPVSAGLDPLQHCLHVCRPLRSHCPCPVTAIELPGCLLNALKAVASGCSHRAHTARARAKSSHSQQRHRQELGQGGRRISRSRQGSAWPRWCRRP